MHTPAFGVISQDVILDAINRWDWHNWSDAVDGAQQHLDLAIARLRTGQSAAEPNRAWDGVFLREITSAKARLEMVGGTVCHFGRGSGYSCGVVDSIHHDPGGICNVASDDVWVLIWDDPGPNCWEGDSGGPFMMNNTAWGTTKSSALGGNPDDCDGMAFMSVGALNWDGVNTRLLLTP